MGYKITVKYEFSIGVTKAYSMYYAAEMDYKSNEALNYQYSQITSSSR